MGAPVAPEVLQRTRALTAPAMRAAIERLGPRVRLPVEYHLGWVDMEGRPTDADSGKNIRAALAVLSAEAVAADASVGVPGAVAIELVHNFSLIHDDVMDNDRERRHRLTVWAAFGSAEAIIAGDALATLAVQVLLDHPGPATVRALRTLQGATAHMIDGQADDVAFEGRDTVTLDDCVAMARAKTGALLSCASSLGAILANATETRVRALGEFGMQLGLAFQAVDDVLGIWGEPRVTGKPVFSDLRQQKKTIPIVAALERGGGERLSELLEASRQSADAAAQAAELIDAHGGRAVAEDLAASCLDAALAALARAEAKPEPAAELEAIAHFVVGRDK